MSTQTQQFTPPSKCPKLADLADACNTGACNSLALIKHFGERITELQFGEVREHPAVKIILGQLSYLCGESLGPTYEAHEAYEQWLKSDSAQS